MRRFDIGSGISIVFVAVLAAVAYFYQDVAMGTMRQALENGYLKIFLNMIILIIVLTHTIKVQAQSSSRSLLVKSGFLPVDMSLTIGTYMAVSTTACSLLEGAFLQQFYDVTYFLKFDQLDIYVLIGVSALLLWYVALHMYQIGVELLFPVATPELSTEEMHNKSRQSDASRTGASA
ncbi:hypothetical protein [Shewanella metallivivens]|uniref:Uncharacterized protein n=1 Tax=Shewanella metallivivens TaxID=2872342 RepID=A0ABT5TQK7_9GAMM|nr:hypothetical protein [Shewanella metallivivens]MDD8060782.1 hypothetical protein [Shewanella metallivivens]|tara:strand:+ start:7570 stop:8100 length:531 start_codon:yes stop_codon:yes gene_type:complete